MDQPASDNFDFLFRVIIVGDSGVGKTNLLLRFTKNEFDANSNSTIGVDFATKTVKIGHRFVKAQIWDTAGQDRFKSISTAFYRGASAALLVYDITNRNSFLNVNKWYEDVKKMADQHAVLMLVGNKCDMSANRVVSVTEAREYAERQSMSFIETSALDSTNVEEAFVNILNEVCIVHFKFKKDPVQESQERYNTTANSPKNIKSLQEDMPKSRCC